MIKLFEHKFAIALVLSGLVHSLFLFGGFKNALLVQLPLAEKDVLYLEFVQHSSMESSLQKAKEESREETEKMPALLQEVVSQRMQQFIQKKPEDELTQVKSSVEVAEGNSNQSKETTKETTKETENDSRLVQLVYQAINQHKRFPYMARRLSQQGKVIVNFVMHPDGMVTDVMVIESSNYSILDKAAQEAVAAISPFAMASDYLRNEKVFDVAVDFRLN